MGMVFWPTSPISVRKLPFSRPMDVYQHGLLHVSRLWPDAYGDHGTVLKHGTLSDGTKPSPITHSSTRPGHHDVYDLITLRPHGEHLT